MGHRTGFYGLHLARHLTAAGFVGVGVERDGHFGLWGIGHRPIPGRGLIRLPPKACPRRRAGLGWGIRQRRRAPLGPKARGRDAPQRIAQHPLRCLKGIRAQGPAVSLWPENAPASSDRALRPFFCGEADRQPAAKVTAMKCQFNCRRPRPVRRRLFAIGPATDGRVPRSGDLRMCQAALAPPRLCCQRLRWRSIADGGPEADTGKRRFETGA